MGTKSERQDTKKAVVYDIQRIITEKEEGLDPETVARIVKIMNVYIDASTQK